MSKDRGTELERDLFIDARTSREVKCWALRGVTFGIPRVTGADSFNSDYTLDGCCCVLCDLTECVGLNACYTSQSFNSYLLLNYNTNQHAVRPIVWHSFFYANVCLLKYPFLFT